MTVVVVATVVQLARQGRSWWCACGEWSPWSSDVWGPHNSQHLLDPYSITHVSHGLLLYSIATWMRPKWSGAWRLTAVIMVESLWEVVENTSIVIDRYRSTTAALGYEGDTIANSLGDVGACLAGCWLAGRMGIGRSIIILVALDLVLLLWIRDCFALNVVMLLSPLDRVRAWQMGL